MQPQSSCLLPGDQGASGASDAAEGPQRDRAARLWRRTGEAPLGTHQGGSPLKSRVGAKGLLSGDGARGKEYNEDDDDKDNDTDDDNHLHILPPELPGHLLGCCLEVFRRGFQVLGLVSEVVQVFPSGQDPLHILGHNILDPLHLALQAPDPVISGTPTALLHVSEHLGLSKQNLA